jgi:cytoskeleton protein RodZ
MKHKTAQEENATSQQTVDGPGSQLRKARERQGLEQSKMAAQLHLSQPMIQALEWDDYEKLPAAVFVQGYLRNYARLLDVDENAVIHAYQKLNPDAEQKPLPRNQPDEVARELHSDNRLIRLITWLVFPVMGVLIFFWWQGRMDSTESTAPVEAQQQDMIEPGFAPPQQDEPGLFPDEALPGIREPAVESDSSRAESAPTTFAEPPALEQPVIETPMTESEPEPELEPELEPEPPIETKPAAEAMTTEVEPGPAARPESAPPAPAAAAGAAGAVVFEFTGPCWVEVRDATGRARIIGVMREGARRTLDAGLGPFSVVIGDINAARLSVNGEAYDLGRHTRGKVARFTLDPSQL